MKGEERETDRMREGYIVRDTCICKGTITCEHE